MESVRQRIDVFFSGLLCPLSFFLMDCFSSMILIAFHMFFDGKKKKKKTVNDPIIIKELFIIRAHISRVP